MKKTGLYIVFVLLSYSCTYSQTSGNGQGYAKLPAVTPGEHVADFAAGCFWASSEALLELKGVNSVVSGYAGGNVVRPTYEAVCSDKTGHAETVQVYYDPKIISYAKLVEAFLYAHNPTELNYQGPDRGTSYRSAIFYRNAEEKAIIQKTINQVSASKYYDAPIVTQVLPFSTFYPAESYHQNYFRLHPESPYIQNVSVPKILKLRKKENSLLKPEFQNN
ncbi:peptide-methionine (S)-S-oxide reductase MsrA [Mucilaginibacter sabulilitoris]|uniref:Peptide methionine sulfoxide reductase MsrA n=1 Tax=Mucilaginibacter sabulilitoris TaxID=1173583 RepID=A0ABZ0TV52_9SPHI|nr:peptide-methionine (S)-S-oxide reductase MsrA [Mucilaginibacter sabulilitoris]WPU96962.1 peptide-methionine (S)-S-oxide reductase MsrA [Mucilaginibacter sabulilitoris]